MLNGKAWMVAGVAVAWLWFAAFSPEVAAGQATCQYDASGRLTRVVYSDGSSIRYEYDAAGNRTRWVKTGPSTAGAGSGSESAVAAEKGGVSEEGATAEKP